MDHEHESESRKGWLESRSNWVLLAFLAIAGFYLITEHRAHVFGLLPFLPNARAVQQCVPHRRVCNPR